MTARLRDIAARLSSFPHTLKLIWFAARGWTLAWVGLRVLQGLLPVATVLLVRQLVDRLVMAINAGGNWSSLQPFVVLGALIAGVWLVSELLQHAIEWIHAVQAEYIEDYITALIHAKSIAADLAFYESPEYHDRFARARSDASGRSLALLQSSGGLLQSSMTLLAMAGVLMPYGRWIPLVLFLSTLPALIVVLRFNTRYHQWWENTTTARRWAQYYDTVLTWDRPAAELRLFGLGPSFRAAYDAVRQRLRTEHIQLLGSQHVAHLLAATAALLIALIPMVWMAWRAIQGLVTLGDLALFYQAFQRGQGLMRSLLGSAGAVYANSLFLGNLFQFLDLQPEVLEPSQPQPTPTVLQQGITFQGVTFCYPGSNRIALDNFDLVIEAGQTVAIIGANGAGKSTLLKLLCRLYDPQEGTITVDGQNIRELCLADLRRLMTVLFQFPAAYHATAGQNIGLGDMEGEPDANAIEAAARKAGAHELIKQLPEGYDTLLGKWFVDGTELSGGEWQRIGAARALVRQAQVLILDEPTSMMDAWAEAAWVKRLRTWASGCTAVIITHRLTTAMHADVIHVMESGRIVESGCHQSLLAEGGRYAQAWLGQGLAETGQTPLGPLHEVPMMPSVTPKD